MGFKEIDGKLQWRPNSKPQQEFLALPFDITEGLYGGEAGGGKTEVLLAHPIALKFNVNGRGVPLYELPWFKGIYFRKSFPQIRDSLIPRSREFYPHTGATFNESHTRWTWPSGAWMRFGYIDTKADAYKYDTNEYNLMVYEELTEFLEFCYLYPLHRVRGPLHIIRAAATPGNVGNSWVFDRFIKKAPEGYRVLRETRRDGTQTTRIFIPARLEDNQDLLKDDPSYLARLNLLPEAERRAKRGDWNAFAGQVFREFRQVRYPDEPENAVHCIEPFPVPGYWPKVVAIDWGHDAMTWAGIFAVAPNKRVYLIKEFVAFGESIAIWAGRLRALLATIPGIVHGVIDPSASKNDGHEKTIKQQVEEHLGMWLEKANNDRVSGKMLVHEYLRFIPKPSIHGPEGFSMDVAQRILRMYGPEKYQQYLGTYQEEKEDTTALPKLQIFNDCEVLIETIPKCIFKEKKDDTSTEDVKEFRGDDPYDGLRYGLKAVHRFLTASQEGEAEFLQRARIFERLQQTGDMNAFYREMARHEAGDGEAISLFHGASRPGNSRIFYEED